MAEYVETRKHRALTFGERHALQMGAPLKVKVALVAGYGFRVLVEG